jgi:uncharacterized protein YndB with AHSA1/START domain
MNDYGRVIGPRAVQFERVLPGPIERVWKYLTEPNLRKTWFADGPMDCRIGGAITFHFQHQRITDFTEALPERFKMMADGPIVSHGTITVWEPPRRLAFTWEPDSEVAIDLVASGPEVQLTLTQTKLATRAEMVDVSSGWHVHLGVLAERLDGKTPAPFWPRVERAEHEYAEHIPPDDPRPPSNDRIHYVVYIGGTVATVWNALTNPDVTQRYWGGTRMESEWQPGAPLRYVINGKVTDEHTILSIDAPRRLVHTFRPVFGEFANEPPSQVEYTLEQLDGSVKLTMLHDHFPAESAVHRACSNGWPMVLSGLKTIVETGKPLPGVMLAP